MQRREFNAGIGATLAWPLTAGAQQAAVRVGFLPVGSASNAYDRSLVEAFRLGLRELGVVENRDVGLDIIWVNDESELPHAVFDLVQRVSQCHVAKMEMMPVGFTIRGDVNQLVVTSRIIKGAQQAVG